MDPIEQLQNQLNKLQRRMTIIYSAGAVVVVAGLLFATMGMANNNQNRGQNIVASRIAIVDNSGREIMTLGTTTEGTAGIWLKRGNSTNAFLVQQKDNTAHLWARNYRLESSASRDIALFGVSTEGRAGMWLMDGNRSNNILLQTPDNNVKLWAHDYYVKHNNRNLASLGTSDQGNGGVWLYKNNQSTWALAINP